MADESWVGQIGKELERIFRYLLPGIAILGFARLSHPSWFYWVHPENSQHLILLAAIALCAGSSWYVVHRYSLHQALDLLAYRMAHHRFSGYSVWLAKHVASSMRGKEQDALLRRNVGLRSAQTIFMFIIAEAALLFSLVRPDPSSVFGNHKLDVTIPAVAIIVVALLQQWLCYKIDVHAVESGDKGSSG